MIVRADIKGSRSDVALNDLSPVIPVDFSGVCFSKLLKPKGLKRLFFHSLYPYKKTGSSHE